MIVDFKSLQKSLDALNTEQIKLRSLRRTISEKNVFIKFYCNKKKVKEANYMVMFFAVDLFLNFLGKKYFQKS